MKGDLVPEPEEPPATAEALAADQEDDAAPGAEDANQEPDTDPPVTESCATSTLDQILSGSPSKAPTAPGEEAPHDPVELSEQDLRLMELAERRAISKKRVALESTVAAYLDVPRLATMLLGVVVQPEVTADLVAALADDDEELRDAALHSLVRHGEKLGTLPDIALEPLLRCIGGENADLRLLAVRAFGWLTGAGIDATLRGLASDDDPLIRLEAVRALDARGVADDRTLACLKDDYSGVRLAAASALARHRGPAAVDPLVEFAFADDGTYRREVGRLLGAFAREPATRALLRILGEERHKRRWLVAIDALAEMFQQPEPPEELPKELNVA